MNFFLVVFNGSNQIGELPPNRSIENVALSYGVTDPSLYAEFDSADFDAACYNFSGAFTLSGSVVGFDLAKAKEIGDLLINQQSNAAARKTLEGLSYDVYVAQSTLPADQRIAKYQAAIDANNALAIETENREQALYSASSIQEVNAIVYPPKD